MLKGRCRCGGFIGRYCSFRIASVAHHSQRRRQGHHIARQISNDRESRRRAQLCLGRPIICPCFHVQTAQCTRILLDGMDGTVSRCRQKRGDRPRADAVTPTRARETVNQCGEATRRHINHIGRSANTSGSRTGGIRNGQSMIIQCGGRCSKRLALFAPFFALLCGGGEQQFDKGRALMQRWQRH